MSLTGRVIGLIEDDAIMGESLVQSLGLEGAYVDWWRCGDEALRGLKATSPDVVICDIRLPDTSGDRVFREISATRNAPPFLFMTAFGEIDQAVHLIRAGGGDYVTKPFDMPHFVSRVRALIRQPVHSHDDAILGASPPMRAVEAMLQKVCAIASPVLLIGETGSGKEICARRLHAISPRSSSPWIAVNCAALPPDLLESELFGHERGAFTGAHALHRGFAERAGDGTLFLDEVGELAPTLQAKLLRLLEEKSFYRVGGERPIPFKARIVCASNIDVEVATRSGKLRPDLLHRINTITVRVPPLRERAEDIVSLMEMFLDQLKPSSRTMLRGFATTALDAAVEHDWPGNVRELRNRVERATALAEGEWIMPADLFPDLASTPSVPPHLKTLSEVRDEAERKQISRALRQSEGHPAAAAALLGVSRTTLWEKMRRLGISVDEAN